MTSKPLDQMTTQELKLAWGKRAKDFLVGRKIVDVYYHSEKENEEIFGDMDSRTNIKIVFDNGHWITASQDDEGNGSGVIFTTDPKLPVIPSIQRGTPDQLPGNWVPGSWQLHQLKCINAQGLKDQGTSSFQAAQPPQGSRIFFNYLVDIIPMISYIIDRVK